MLQPNAIILYVENLAITARFYEDLLGLKPKESSPTFQSFQLTNGMGLGLKSKQSVLPTAEANSSGELAFILDNHRKVDELYTEWQNKGPSIALPPTALPYGYTFLALDPDGNRLRVVSLN
ncbi:MAG: VOC family protein [Tatlockia sp.]|nr:VOC family protein [Tatlockia sp.]